MSYISTSQKSFYMLLTQTSFFGYYGGYYGITGVIPCPVEQKARKGTKAGEERFKGRQGKAQRQARKGTKAGKEWYKGRQGMAQRQSRKGTKAMHKGKVQRQARKGTKVGEERHKGSKGKVPGYKGGR
jgi:hypothetical protein